MRDAGIGCLNILTVMYLNTQSPAANVVLLTCRIFVTQRLLGIHKLVGIHLLRFIANLNSHILWLPLSLLLPGLLSISRRSSLDIIPSYRGFIIPVFPSHDRLKPWAQIIPYQVTSVRDFVMTTGVTDTSTNWIGKFSLTKLVLYQNV